MRDLLGYVDALFFDSAAELRAFDVGRRVEGRGRAEVASTLLVDYPEAARLLGITVPALKSRVIRRQLQPGVIKRTGRRVQFVRAMLGGVK